MAFKQRLAAKRRKDDSWWPVLADEPLPHLFEPAIPEEQPPHVWLSGSRYLRPWDDALCIVSPNAFATEAGAIADAADLRNPANQVILKLRIV